MITYKTSVNLIVAKEENNVERTMSEVASRLANSDQELTLVRTYRNLTKNDAGRRAFMIALQRSMAT